MGISVQNVIDKSKIVHIICSICTDVIEDAIMLKTCDHMFCRVCITEWIHWIATGDTRCPECRQCFLTSDFGKPNRIILNLIADVKFECTNKGCREIISHGDYSLHSMQCTKAEIQCDFCNILMERWQIEGHKARFF